MTSHTRHAVLWPPSDATWLLPHHLQANTLLHGTLDVLPNKGLFSFFFLCVSPPPPPPRGLACPLPCGGCLWSSEDDVTLQGSPTPSQPREKRWWQAVLGRVEVGGGQKTKAVLANPNYS